MSAVYTVWCSHEMWPELQANPPQGWCILASRRTKTGRSVMVEDRNAPAGLAGARLDPVLTVDQETSVVWVADYGRPR